MRILALVGVVLLAGCTTNWPGGGPDQVSVPSARPTPQPWTVRLDSSSMPPIASDAGVVAVLYPDHSGRDVVMRLAAWDAAVGKPLWNRTTQARDWILAAADGNAYVVEEGAVVAYALATGAKAWRVDLRLCDGCVMSTEATPMVHAHTLFLPLWSVLAAVDLSAHRLAWSFTPDPPAGIVGPAVAGAETIVVYGSSMSRSHSPWLFGIDVASGQLLWTSDSVEGVTPGVPLGIDDGDKGGTLAVQTDHERTSTIDLFESRTGRPLASRPLEYRPSGPVRVEGSIAFRPSMSTRPCTNPEPGKACDGSQQAVISAVDESTNLTVWSTAADNPPVFHGDWAIFIHWGGQDAAEVTAFNAASRLSWRQRLTDCVELGVPVPLGSLLLVPCQDKDGDAILEAWSWPGGV